MALLLILGEEDWPSAFPARGCSTNQRTKACMHASRPITQFLISDRVTTTPTIASSSACCIDRSAEVNQVYTQPWNLENKHKHKHKPWTLTLSCSKCAGDSQYRPLQLHRFPGINPSNQSRPHNLVHTSCRMVEPILLEVLASPPSTQTYLRYSAGRHFLRPPVAGR